jgi:hypothetical protein
MLDFLFYKRRNEASRLLTGRINQQTMAGLQPGERRTSRSTYCEVVWLIENDGYGNPDFAGAEPVVSKDISPSGLSLIHSRRVAGTHVIIGMKQPEGMSFLKCRLGHCTPLGCGFHQIGLLPEGTASVPARVATDLRERFDNSRHESVTVG